MFLTGALYSCSCCAATAAVRNESEAANARHVPMRPNGQAIHGKLSLLPLEAERPWPRTRRFKFAVGNFGTSGGAVGSFGGVGGAIYPDTHLQRMIDYSSSSI